MLVEIEHWDFATAKQSLLHFDDLNFHSDLELENHDSLHWFSLTSQMYIFIEFACLVITKSDLL